MADLCQEQLFGLARPAFSLDLIRGSYREGSGSSAWDCMPGQAIFHGSGEIHSDQFFDEGGDLLNLEILPEFEERLRGDGIRIDLWIVLDHPHCLELALKLRQKLRVSDSVSGLAAEGSGDGTGRPCASRLLTANGARGHWINRIDATLREQLSKPPSLAEGRDVACTRRPRGPYIRKRLQCSVGKFVRLLWGYLR